jgi:cephalosporin hydroxylase
MNEAIKFQEYVQQNITKVGDDRELQALSQSWVVCASKIKYVHNLTWLGRPILQVPQDIYAVQEIIWNVRPDLIIETGVAHGGSLMMSASMLAMLDYCDAVTAGTSLDPKASARKVIGIDIDIRAHNRSAIEAHPMSHMITLLQGSSVSNEVVSQVNAIASQYKKVMVFLDSNHTHEHVLAELEAYAPMVSLDSYCIVFDTGVEDLPDTDCADRPWGKGNNPKTAVWEYLKHCKATGDNAAQFAIDKQIEHKLAITGSPDGFLKRVQ